MAPSLAQLKEFGQEYGPLIGVLAVCATAGITLLFRWPAKLWARWRRRRGRSVDRSGLPTQTIRAVLEHVSAYRGAEWGHASRGEEKGMHLHARWTFTNISRAPVKLVDAYLDLRPRVHGIVFVRHPKSDIYGGYFLVPGIPVPGSADFLLFPPIRKPGQDLKSAVVLVDNLGNEHRSLVLFRGPARKAEDAGRNP